MADLKKAFNFAMKLEGGGRIHTVPGDPGGTTQWGLSQRANPDLRFPLTREQAIEVYRARYWNPRLLDHVNSQVMADEIFEFTINADPANSSGGRAIVAAQTAANFVLELLDSNLRVNVDGRMGPVTVGALNFIHAAGPLAVAAWEGAPQSFNIRQLATYRGLRRDLVDRFLLGWTRRVVE